MTRHQCQTLTYVFILRILTQYTTHTARTMYITHHKYIISTVYTLNTYSILHIPPTPCISHDINTPHSTTYVSNTYTPSTSRGQGNRGTFVVARVCLDRTTRAHAHGRAMYSSTRSRRAICVLSYIHKKRSTATSRGSALHAARDDGRRRRRTTSKTRLCSVTSHRIVSRDRVTTFARRRRRGDRFIRFIHSARVAKKRFLARRSRRARALGTPRRRATGDGRRAR